MINEIDFTIEKMLQKYGKDSQIDVCIEEMSELTKELIKNRRSEIHKNENISLYGIKEEMADVLFMFEYLKKIFGISNTELKIIVRTKAARTRRRYLNNEIHN